MAKLWRVFMGPMGVVPSSLVYFELWYTKPPLVVKISLKIDLKLAKMVLIRALLANANMGK